LAKQEKRQVTRPAYVTQFGNLQMHKCPMRKGGLQSRIHRPTMVNGPWHETWNST